MKFLSKRRIKLERELSRLDKFVLDFVNILERYARYVIVSGYVSILFGRSRATEDIDFLVQPLSKEKLKELFNNLEKNGFYCINTSNPEEAFNMLKEHAIRFARKNQAIPNIEFKTIKNDLDRYSFENKTEVKLIKGKKSLFISPFEIQIAYKLYLGSEKDIEDAKHLYVLFKRNIDKKTLNFFLSRLKVKEKFEKFLK